MILAIALMVLSFFLVKRNGYEEYGVAGLLIGSVMIVSFGIYYIWKYLA